MDGYRDEKETLRRRIEALEKEASAGRDARAELAFTRAHRDKLARRLEELGHEVPAEERYVERVTGSFGWAGVLVLTIPAALMAASASNSGLGFIAALGLIGWVIRKSWLNRPTRIVVPLDVESRAAPSQVRVELAPEETVATAEAVELPIETVTTRDIEAS